jgi:hypothetical protein
MKRRIIDKTCKRYSTTKHTALTASLHDRCLPSTLDGGHDNSSGHD